MDKWQPSFIDPEEIQRRDLANEQALSSAEDYPARMLAFAKMGLEEQMGIKLTNIELVGLRKIVKDAIEEAKQNNTGLKYHYSLIAPVNECQETFLRNFYGTSFDQLDKVFPKDDPDSKLLRWEYFKREQAKLHNEL